MEEIALTLIASLSRLTPNLIQIITPILVKDSVNLLRKHPTATFVIYQVPIGSYEKDLRAKIFRRKFFEKLFFWVFLFGRVLL